jgi:hypothetical protein
LVTFSLEKLHFQAEFAPAGKLLAREVMHVDRFIEEGLPQDEEVCPQDCQVRRDQPAPVWVTLDLPSHVAILVNAPLCRSNYTTYGSLPSASPPLFQPR